MTMRSTNCLKPYSTHSITSTNAGAIELHVFEPQIPGTSGAPRSVPIRGTIVTVHPWSVLGGGEHNTVGIARHITASSTNPSKTERRDVARDGWRVIMFALKSRGAVWGILSSHSYEVQQTVDVVNWAIRKYGTDAAIVLLGSSAGAPIAGTAMDRMLQQEQERNNGHIISAYVAVGYTFGTFASLAFGRHFPGVVGKIDSSTTDAGALPPKLFIMGERDEFTSVDQLDKMVIKMRANSNVDVEIVADVGHFELESSSYDPKVAEMILGWLNEVLK